jgi:hypothetical protein
MKASFRYSINYFVLIIIFVFGNCTEEFSDLDMIPEMLDVIFIEREENRFWPKQFEEEPFISQSYEFVSGIESHEGQITNTLV